jgi:hypothetical protein
VELILGLVALSYRGVRAIASCREVRKEWKSIIDQSIPQWYSDIHVSSIRGQTVTYIRNNPVIYFDQAYWLTHHATVVSNDELVTLKYKFSRLDSVYYIGGEINIEIAKQIKKIYIPSYISSHDILTDYPNLQEIDYITDKYETRFKFTTSTQHHLDKSGFTGKISNTQFRLNISFWMRMPPSKIN